LHYVYPRKTKTTTITILIIIIITVSSSKPTLSDTMMIVGSGVLAAATTQVKYYASGRFWKAAQRTTSLPKRAV
jgi:hypothetical protein